LKFSKKNSTYFKKLTRETENKDETGTEKSCEKENETGIIKKDKDF